MAAHIPVPKPTSPRATSYRTDLFELGDRRLMLSLGRLTPKRYCTYRCPFCYVNVDYESFASLPVQEIVDWALAQDPETYDTVYVSGDTDSFAPPKQATGLALLECLTALRKDLLFTTRAIFDTDGLGRLGRINEALRGNGNWLFGCVSICQWSVPKLEPSPIAHPRVRAAQGAEFQEHGLVSVLAIRPFLPNVPLNDYTRIINACGGAVDLVLGEDWYADVEGKLERSVLGTEHGPDFFIVGGMPFDSNESPWRVYKLESHENHVRSECERLGLPFFMRSGAALAHWRDKNGKSGQ
jgi:hypothetical protein